MHNGFIEYLYYITLYKEQFDSQTNYWVVFGAPALGAFLGAFFAFLASLFVHRFTQRGAIWEKHLSGIHHCQLILGEALYSIYHNTTVLTELHKALQQSHDYTSIGSRPMTIETVPLTVLNDIRGARTGDHVRVFNQVAVNINNQVLLVMQRWEDNRNWKMDSRIHPDVTNRVTANLMAELQNLHEKLYICDVELKESLAVVRIRLKRDKPLSLWRLRKKPPLLHPSFEEIQQEKQLIEIEVSRNRETFDKKFANGMKITINF